MLYNSVLKWLNPHNRCGKPSILKSVPLCPWPHRSAFLKCKRCREISKDICLVLDTVGNSFWRLVYLRMWPSELPGWALCNSRTPENSTQASFIYQGKNQFDGDEDGIDEDEDEDDRSLQKLLGPVLPHSIPPPLTDNGIDPSKIDWKYYCREHAFNRIDWVSVPRDGKPVLALKPSLTGAVYRCQAGSSSGYGHKPIRSVRGEKLLEPLFCGGKIGYYELKINQNGGEQIITPGVCSRSFPMRSKAVGWTSDAASSALAAGFHCDDGRKFVPSDPSWSGTPRWNTPTGTKPTTVGCGVNFETKEVFFTRDGHFLGIAYAFQKIPARALEDFISSGWYPVVALMANPADVDFNFGQRPFVFDLKHQIMWSTFGAGVTPPLGYLAGTTYDPVPFQPDRVPPKKEMRRHELSDSSSSGESYPEASDVDDVYDGLDYNSDDVPVLDVEDNEDDHDAGED